MPANRTPGRSMTEEGVRQTEGSFRQIAPEEAETAYKSAWSMENIGAHEAEDRSLQYIGSQLGGLMDGGGTAVFDYYRDSEGEYWYRTRAWLPDGGIVSMDQYIFGSGGRRMRRRRSSPWQRGKGQAGRHAVSLKKNAQESTKK